MPSRGLRRLREHKACEIVRPDMAKTAKRGGAATKRWLRIEERLHAVRSGERVSVSLAARNKARPLVREHLARRVGDNFDE